MTKARIMIVEDDNIVVMELRYRLESLGYDVSGETSYGEEAVKIAGKTNPDLVLMDIKLKGNTNGIEAAEKIRARFGIPIVYLTALADENTLRRVKMTEHFGFVVKPFEERELRDAIEKSLSKYNREKRDRLE